MDVHAERTWIDGQLKLLCPAYARTKTRNRQNNLRVSLVNVLHKFEAASYNHDRHHRLSSFFNCKHQYG
jgi:hypothetical protein